jgi:NAD(P)H-nitrite reductase large subunit
MHYVILGAGVAGVTAAETVRRHDDGATISLIGEEREPPYARMAIPYLLAGSIDEAGTTLRKAPGHYARLGIEHRFEKAVRVDTPSRRVTLSDGSTTGYDRLLIATGASPIKPPVPGIDLAVVQHCWTLADARAIAGLARPGARVVLMGAGFIGCIIMEALAARGVHLTVVEMGDRMVPRMMNHTAGNLIRRWTERKGVRVLTGARVAAIRALAAGGAEVELADHTLLPADLVVCATGVRANAGFLAGSGILVDQGVVVDDCLRASAPDVWAAGDVAQGPDFFDGRTVVHAIQPTSSDHGRIAGLNMAGRAGVPFQGSLIMNVLDTMGLISVSYGQWQGVSGGDAVERLDEDRFAYVHLAFADDVLVGAITLGRTDHIGAVRGLIQGRVRLGEWKRRLQADPTRLAEAFVAKGLG